MRKTSKTSQKSENLTQPQTDVIESSKELKNNSGQKTKIMVIAFLALFLGGVFYLKNSSLGGIDKNKLKSQIIPDAVSKIVNNPSIKINIGDLKDANGVYEFELTLGDKGQKYNSYITKDGKILFTSGIKLDVLGKTTQTTPQPEAKKLTCNDLPKIDSPNLTAFIVSNCPYGLQMQRLLKKTIDELPQIANQLTVRYIGSVSDNKIISMHGDKEAQENLKQICIREEQKEKYWNYISCYIQGGDSEGCSATAGIDTAQLNACITDQNRGLKYAKVDFDLANKLNVGSSPTLILDNKQTVSEFDFGGRTPNAIKEIIGCSYKTKPDAYKNALSKDEVATSFSQTVNSASTGGSTGGAPAANCNPAK